jgi:hypothetical protein
MVADLTRLRQSGKYRLSLCWQVRDSLTPEVVPNFVLTMPNFRF